MEFGPKLQNLRKQKNLTQEELANLLCVSRTAISKWESGRGYPSIDSLKTIAVFFNTTVDDLLSGNELLILAEESAKQKNNSFCDLIYGLLDISVAILFFLPLLAQKSEGAVQAISLLSLSEIATYLKALYYIVILSIILCGVITLALQKCDNSLWLKSKYKVSLIINSIASLLFVVSQQPYAATFLLILLAIKITILRRK